MPKDTPDIQRKPQLTISNTTSRELFQQEQDRHAADRDRYRWRQLGQAQSQVDRCRETCDRADDLHRLHLLQHCRRLQYRQEHIHQYLQPPAAATASLFILTVHQRPAHDNRFCSFTSIYNHSPTFIPPKSFSFAHHSRAYKNGEWMRMILEGWMWVNDCN